MWNGLHLELKYIIIRYIPLCRLLWLFQKVTIRFEGKINDQKIKMLMNDCWEQFQLVKG